MLPRIICDVSATLSQHTLRYDWPRRECPFPAINPAHAKILFIGIEGECRKLNLPPSAARKDMDARGIPQISSSSGSGSTSPVLALRQSAGLSRRRHACAVGRRSVGPTLVENPAHVFRDGRQGKNRLAIAGEPSVFSVAGPARRFDSKEACFEADRRLSGAMRGFCIGRSRSGAGVDGSTEDGGFAVVGVMGKTLCVAPSRSEPAARDGDFEPRMIARRSAAKWKLMRTAGGAERYSAGGSAMSEMYCDAHF